MKGNIILHLIHIDSTRMIAYMMNGLSRGITTEGVMSWDSLLEHVTLHLGCMKRSKEVESLIRSFWSTEECISLKYCTPKIGIEGQTTMGAIYGILLREQ